MVFICVLNKYFELENDRYFVKNIWDSYEFDFFGYSIVIYIVYLLLKIMNIFNII